MKKILIITAVIMFFVFVTGCATFSILQKEPQFQITRFIAVEDCPGCSGEVKEIENNEFDLYQYENFYIEFEGLKHIKDDYGTKVNVEFYGTLYNEYEVVLLDGPIVQCFECYIEDMNEEMLNHYIENGKWVKFPFYAPPLRAGNYMIKIIIKDFYAEKEIEDFIIFKVNAKRTVII